MARAPESSQQAIEELLAYHSYDRSTAKGAPMGARRLRSTYSILVLLSRVLSALDLSLGIFLTPLAADAQPSAKIPRLGCISPGVSLPMTTP